MSAAERSNIFRLIDTNWTAGLESTDLKTLAQQTFAAAKRYVLGGDSSEQPAKDLIELECEGAEKEKSVDTADLDISVAPFPFNTLTEQMIFDHFTIHESSRTASICLVKANMANIQQQILNLQHSMYRSADGTGPRELDLVKSKHHVMLVQQQSKLLKDLERLTCTIGVA